VRLIASVLRMAGALRMAGVLLAVGALQFAVAAPEPAPEPRPANANGLPDPEARYRQERERCERMPSPDERATCLREASAARAEARRGSLGNSPGDPIRYLENALRRCEPLPPDERADCEYRVRGGGATRGSVEAGGIYRETVTREIPAQPAEPASPASPTSPASPASTVTPVPGTPR
jgi:hypothetical protein